MIPAVRDPILSDAEAVGRALGREPPRRIWHVGAPHAAQDARYDYIVAAALPLAAPEPGAALASLAERLAPGGAIGVAVPGRIALLPLAQAREVFALLRDLHMPVAEDAARLLRALPASAWLRRRPPTTDEAELVALLTKPAEPAATLDELAEIAAAAGFTIAAVAPRADYEVAASIMDATLRARVEALPDVLRWAFAERWSARIRMHRVFLERTRKVAPPKPPPAGRHALAEQYEAYPYPARDPAEEAKRLHIGSPSNLPELDQHVFGGRRGERRAFRALAAGGGTGDATILLAQQLALVDPDATVVHLDLSRASQAIARARASARHLANVRFVHGSLLDLDALGLGGFDYIDCCGVLHHLGDPGAGLRALAHGLKPDGGIGMMLYGAIGRTGVYPLQEALRWIAPASELAAPERIDLARRLVRALPKSNLFAADPALTDHVHGGDAGVFDLLLHSRDRAFRVPELYALAAESGLRITALVPPGTYRPSAYLNDPDLRARTRALDPERQAAAGELLGGRLTKHVCYLVKSGNPVAPPRLDDADAVPVWRSPQEGQRLAAWHGGSFTARLNGMRVDIGLPPQARGVIAAIDGRRPLGTLLASLASPEDARTAQRALSSLLDLGILFLRKL